MLKCKYFVAVNSDWKEALWMAESNALQMILLISFEALNCTLKAAEIWKDSTKCFYPSVIHMIKITRKWIMLIDKVILYTCDKT